LLFKLAFFISCAQSNESKLQNSQHVMDVPYQATLPERVFTHIYERDLWGKGSGMAGEGSGPGSSLARCKPLIEFLKLHLATVRAMKASKSKEHKEHKELKQSKEQEGTDDKLSFLDIGCGDMQWMPALLDQVPTIAYMGIDCVRNVVDANVRAFPHLNFMRVDFMSRCATEGLPDADVFFCKDVLQHYSSGSVVSFLTTFFQRFPDAHLLVVNCNYQTTNERRVDVGGFAPLNGLLHPLNKFSPMELFSWDTKTVYRLFPPQFSMALLLSSV
jgi:hypothetical protein